MSNMQLYAQNMRLYANKFQEICRKYANIQTVLVKYAKDMHGKYTEICRFICKICRSLYIAYLAFICTPTLLMIWRTIFAVIWVG